MKKYISVIKYSPKNNEKSIGIKGVITCALFAFFLMNYSVLSAQISACDTVIYCLGSGFTGSNNNAFTNNYAYHTATNTWDTLAPIPAPTAVEAGAAVGNIIYCIGGSATNRNNNAVSSNYGYNTTTNTWDTLAPIPTITYLFYATVVGNKIYCIGGSSSTYSPLTDNYAYNTTTNTWDTLAPLPTPEWGVAVVAVGNMIYCIGGYNASTIYQNNYGYNITTNTWDTLAPIPTACNTLGAAAVGNTIYCIGGWNGADLTNNYGYNTTTNTWDTLAPIPAATGNLVAETVGNKVYCIGGSNSSGYLVNNYAYNTITNTWYTLAPIPTPTVALAGGVVAGPNITLSITPFDTTICSGNKVNLVANGATIYAWSPSTGLSDTTGGTETAAPVITTTYTVIGTKGSCIDSANVVVTVNPALPLIIQPPSPTVCPGQNIALSVSVSGSDYTWSPSTTLNSSTGDTVIATPLVITTYTVTGTDSLGCSASGSTVVLISQTPDTPTITHHENILISSATQGNQWVRNDTVIQGATNQTYTASISGSYQVIAENPANGCSSTSDSINVTTGINQLTVNRGQLSFYPNPTSGKIILNISSSVGEVKNWNLLITDLLGRTRYTRLSLNYSDYIDLSNLPCGVYFICVMNKTGRTMMPVVKQ